MMNAEGRRQKNCSGNIFFEIAQLIGCKAIHPPTPIGKREKKSAHFKF
jgi:hypothetical protein